VETLKLPNVTTEQKLNSFLVIFTILTNERRRR